MGDVVGIPIEVLTPSALLGIAILFIIIGKLWTNPAYQEKVKEAEKWRLAYEAESKARATADAQTAELLEQGKTTHAIVVAMFSIMEGNRSSGGTPHVVPLAK
jgi:hypothetical protein